MGFPDQLRIRSRETRDSVGSFVLYFRSVFLFLKSIKIDPVTKLSSVARPLKLAQ